MKSLLKLLKKRKHLLFLDLEGTQFSHEMIAFGAVRVSLDFRNRVRKVHTGLKFYVQCKNSIGKYVQNLTKITPDILANEGISFKDALVRIQKYCGTSFSKTVFITFGSHDLRIISQSMLNSPDADQTIASHIQKNSIDFSSLLAQFVRDENGNPYSLVNYLKVFDVEPVGTLHDPLCDATNLFNLYKAVVNDKHVLFEQYLLQLQRMKIFPEPVKKTIFQLVNGQSVSPEEFKKAVKEYIK